MSSIQLLDQNTINKIAAGEVIERPAAVVKELIENAIDAGANAITAEIKQGGTSLIRITDNGAGIQKEEIKTAFLRHATSKIKSVEDLLSVSSLGFRGEALSSIASVAQVELVTKTDSDVTGTRYLIEGGEEKLVEEIGCPNGTTFLVRNLFYNTPARRKFLKSETTEAGYISDLIERLALSHPKIAFKFISNNQIKLQSSGNGNLKDIIYHIYGRDVTKNVLEINSNLSNCKLYGYIGKPIVSRGNRNYENYFINGRYIKSGIINKAIEEAYKPYTMMHRYPFTAFHLDIDSENIDVNVHPAKMEIRFKNGEEIYQFIYSSISNLLAGKELIPSVELTKEKEEKKNIVKNPEPFEVNRIKEQQNRNSSFNQNVTYHNSHNQGKTDTKQDIKSNTDFHANIKKNNDFAPANLDNQEIAKIAYNNNNLSEKAKSEIVHSTEIGKFDTIIKNPDLLREDMNYHTKNYEKNDTIYGNNNEDNKIGLVSNAAYEKKPELESNEMIHEKNMNQSETLEKPEQINLFEEKLLSEESKKNHRIIGQVFSTYWIVEFQDKMFLIDQHAAHEKVLYEKIIKSIKEKECFSQMIQPPIIITLTMREEETLKKHMDILTQLGFEIEHFGGKEYSVRAVPSNLFGIAQKELLLDLIDELTEDTPTGEADLIIEKIASMSCKAAVKGNHKLSYEEAEALMDQLLELDNPYNCPHGRPTIISMSKYEIEKKFKRII